MHLTTNKGKELLKLFYAYRQVLKQILNDIYTTILWTAQPIKGKKQQFLLPTYRKDTWLKRDLRCRGSGVRAGEEKAWGVATAG